MNCHFSGQRVLPITARALAVINAVLDALKKDVHPVEAVVEQPMNHPPAPFGTEAMVKMILAQASVPATVEQMREIRREHAKDRLEKFFSLQEQKGLNKKTAK
jgi:hypothetical protein